MEADGHCLARVHRRPAVVVGGGDLQARAAEFHDIVRLLAQKRTPRDPAGPASHGDLDHLRTDHQPDALAGGAAGRQRYPHAFDLDLASRQDLAVDQIADRLQDAFLALRHIAGRPVLGRAEIIEGMPRDALVDSAA